MTCVVARRSATNYSASSPFSNIPLSNTTQTTVASASVQAGALGKITVTPTGQILWGGTESPGFLTGKFQVKWRTAGVGSYTSLTEQTIGTDALDNPIDDPGEELPTAISYTPDLITGLTPDALYDIVVMGRLTVDADNPYLFCSGTLAVSGT